MLSSSVPMADTAPTAPSCHCVQPHHYLLSHSWSNTKALLSWALDQPRSKRPLCPHRPYHPIWEMTTGHKERKKEMIFEDLMVLNRFTCIETQIEKSTSLPFILPWVFPCSISEDCKSLWAVALVLVYAVYLMVKLFTWESKVNHLSWNCYGWTVH